MSAVKHTNGWSATRRVRSLFSSFLLHPSAFLTLFLVLATTPASASEVRIKDLSDIEGAHKNALTGLGLVVGLNNTGGKSPITRRLAMNFVQNNGIRIPPDIRDQIRTDTREKTNNMSVVVVTARLPPFAKKDQTMDVNISAFDDAMSLTGGVLLPTPLLGLDGKVYAIADGNVSVDSFVAGGQAATVQKNHPTAGRITEGAVIEEDVCTTITKDGLARLLLRQPDFETVSRVTTAINRWTPQTARSIDPAVVELNLRAIPPDQVTSFIGQIGMLTVEPDSKAKVVINERTGTIVVGRHVKLSNVLITHGNLAISTKESPEVSQPAPFSDGETTVVPRTDVSAVEEDRPIHVLPETTTVEDLATALNSLGIPPRDLGVIFQQLKDAGALHADLEFK